MSILGEDSIKESITESMGEPHSQESALRRAEPNVARSFRYR